MLLLTWEWQKSKEILNTNFTEAMSSVNVYRKNKYFVLKIYFFFLVHSFIAGTNIENLFSIKRQIAIFEIEQ